MSDLVVYGNDFNFMPLPKLTEFEIDIFMQIVSELNENRELELFFMDLAYEIYTKKHKSANETLEIFYKLADKLLSFKVKYSIKNRHYAFICFEKLELILDEDPNPRIKIKAQEDFYELITNLQMGFTKFELREFITISGKYAKNLYRLLKQFKKTGFLKLNWEDFCNIMQIPTSYKMADIDKRILKPAIKELSAEPNNEQPIFKNLKYEKIKDKKMGVGRGGKVVGIEFTFDKETNETNENNKSKENKPEIQAIQSTEHIEPNLDLYFDKLISTEFGNARIRNVEKHKNQLKVTYSLIKNNETRSELFNSTAELEREIQHAKAKNKTATLESFNNLVKQVKINKENQ